MTIVITLTHGAKTCASEPGKFCRWMSYAGVVANPVCLLFNQPLWHANGWLQRCPECIKEFGENE